MTNCNTPYNVNNGCNSCDSYPYMLEIARVVQCLYNQLAAGGLSGTSSTSLAVDAMGPDLPIIGLAALTNYTLMTATWTNPSATRSASVIVHAKSNIIGQVNNAVATVYNSDVTPFLQFNGVSTGVGTRLLNSGSTPGNALAPLYVFTSHATNTKTIVVAPSQVLTVTYKVYIDSASVGMNVNSIIAPVISILGSII